jgi:protein-S-isoprenylcysteine O-methyltransferase Ste14
MNRVFLTRALVLYVPFLLAVLLGMRLLHTRRQLGAMLVGLCWCLPALLLLQLANLRFHWWSYHVDGGIIRELPVDLYLGWAVMWGALPVLAFPRVKLWLLIGGLFTFDLCAMPLLFPAVELSRAWLIGEFMGVAVVLLPAQLFSRWTLEDSHLRGRAIFHVISSSLLLLFVLPETIFSTLNEGGWSALLSASPWLRSLELQCIAVLGMAGVSAVQEFAHRGHGTPIPFDAPKRLVTSGLYRYVANPMQICCSLVLTALGIMLRDLWVCAGGAIAVIYGAGIAQWDEGLDMKTRFGERWEEYRRNVRNSRPRWRPWHDPHLPPARLYVAEECGPCSEIRRWFESRSPVGLEIAAAEDHPQRDLQRMTYDPMDGTAAEEGVCAFARGLEHLNLGWAYIGACMRLPLIRNVLQLLCDASGLGPQLIRRRTGPQVCELRKQEFTGIAWFRD